MHTGLKSVAVLLALGSGVPVHAAGVVETFPLAATDTFTLEPQTQDGRYYVASFTQDGPASYTENLVEGLAGTTSVSTGRADAFFQLGRSNIAWMPLYSVTLSSDQAGPVDVGINGKTYQVDGPTTIVLDAKPQDAWQFLPETAGVKLTLVDFIGNNSPVPEPASWALMLIGLAGIGGVMRYRAPVSISYDV